jgi:hypothetical protein
MTILNNNITVPTLCPFCKETSQRTILSIKNNEQFQCDCGATYDDDDNSLKNEIATIEKELLNLQFLYSELAVKLENS